MCPRNVQLLTIPASMAGWEPTLLWNLILKCPVQDHDECNRVVGYHVAFGNSGQPSPAFHLDAEVGDAQEF